MAWHTLYHSRTYFWGKDEWLGGHILHNPGGSFTVWDTIFKKERAKEMYVGNLDIVKHKLGVDEWVEQDG